MSAKKFLVPLSVIVGSLSSLNSALASVNSQTEDAIGAVVANSNNSETAIKLNELSTYNVGSDVFAFTLQKAPNGIVLAGHTSHVSHASHRSHYSSR